MFEILKRLLRGTRYYQNLVNIYIKIVSMKKRIYLIPWIKKSHRLVNSNLNNQKMIVVYDSKSCAIAFGEFVCTTMIPRLFKIYGLNIRYYVIQSDIRDDTVKMLSTAEIVGRLREYKNIADCLLGNSGDIIKISNCIMICYDIFCRRPLHCTITFIIITTII